MANETRIVLASGSPRRRELLQSAGIPFEVMTADVEEARIEGEPPEQMVQRLATLKAKAVAARCPDRVVLGADTVVVLNSTVLGKPRGLEDARRMLAALSSRTHRVLTGVALLSPNEPPDVWCCRTAVTFKTLSMADIENYLSLVDVLDKAGSYAIQSHGELLVEAIDGLLSNVIGLPVEDVKEHLGRWNCKDA